MEQTNEFDRQAAEWDLWAATYDDDIAGFLDVDGPVDFIAGAAGGRPVLELGIGSGRIAVPLARRGIAVTGIDASGEMLKRLRQHADELPVDAHVADMADFQLPAQHSVVYVVASTFLLLTTATRQASCVASAARALTPEGILVIEASMPATVIAGDRGIVVRHVAQDHLRLTVQTHDPAAQLVRSQEIRLQSDGRWRMLPSAKRYVSLAELDIMAQLAGLRLHARYNDWDESPLTAASRRHISVYARSADAGRLGIPTFRTAISR